MTHCLRRPSAHIVLAASLLAVACGGPEHESEDTASLRNDQGIVPGDTIDVVLADYTIDMPTVLPAGSLVLRVENQGVDIHDLQFTRVGETTPVWRLSQQLSPGQTALVTVPFDSGRHTAVCDFAGHDGRGMVLDIDVQ